MNQSQAERKLTKLREDSLGYCPLIKSGCRKDCAAYSEGSISKLPYQRPDEEEECWRIYPPRCESPIVSGVIIVES